MIVPDLVKAVKAGQEKARDEIQRKYLMNERIRELAEQAAKKHGHTIKFSPEITETLNSFAELIVRECTSICELNGQSYKHSFTPVKAKLAESTSVYCGTLIKKHFGVEE